jgi:uncharacterized DUF497 family protein
MEADYFEWDNAKAAANLTKHGVSFEQARECFTCGDYSHLVASQRVGNNEQAALHHAEKDHALLAVVLAVVDKVDSERIVEGEPHERRTYHEENG